MAHAKNARAIDLFVLAAGQMLSDGGVVATWISS